MPVAVPLRGVALTAALAMASIVGVGALASPPPPAAAAGAGAVPDGKNVQLWVVGCGTLGSLVAEQWCAAHPDHVVVAETSTDSRHAQLAAFGATPRLRSERQASDAGRAERVVFAVPPSGGARGTGASPEEQAVAYAREVELAAELLGEGPGDRARLVFTSSSGVYAEQGGGVVVEGSPVRADARAERILAAERAALAAGGAAVRLAGLYTETRGAHGFYMSRDAHDSTPYELINLVSYEDAASAVVAALARGEAGRVYLAADGAPLSRLQICEAARLSPEYADRALPAFRGTEGPEGKVLDASATREALAWEPRWRSFAHYMGSRAGGAGAVEEESAAGGGAVPGAGA